MKRVNYLQNIFQLLAQYRYVSLPSIYTYYTIVFYIPKCKGSGRLIAMIHKYGGIVIPQIECCALQILPDTQVDLRYQFGKGFVFSHKWIEESIAA